MLFHRSLVAVMVGVLVLSGCNKSTRTSKQEAANDDDDSPTLKKKKAKAAVEESDEGDEPKSKGGKGCKLPEGDITADFTITKGCKVTIRENVTVKEGAKLLIEPGARLAFAPKTHLWIDHGRLVAKGSEDEPITFTSSNKPAAAGDWEGILFAEKVLSGTVLDNVIVEYAGAEGYLQGAIGFYGASPAGRVTITNSTIRKTAHAGIHNPAKTAGFAKCEGNTFSDVDGVAFAIDADVVGTVGKNKVNGAVIHVLGDHVTKSASWPAIDGAYTFEDSLVIGGEKDSAILKLPNNATLKFAHGNDLWVGHDGSNNGGGLVAKNVTFTSANSSPNAGDWKGLVFDKKSTGTTLTDCTISYAGMEGYGKAAVTFYNWTAKKADGRVTITNLKVDHAEHGAVHSTEDNDCGPFAKEVHADGPVCVKGD